VMVLVLAFVVVFDDAVVVVVVVVLDSVLSLFLEVLWISRYDIIAECPGTVGLSRLIMLSSWRMQPISRLSDVFANALAGLCICLYSLSTCS